MQQIKPLSNGLLATLQQLPSQSGVYHYFDASGRLLYIGKAKNLKKRIKSYFRFHPTLSPAPKLSLRIHQMILQVASLRYVVVEHEHDALILENSLIKQLKPKYNILLRDDKTYPYLYVDLDEPFARINLTRKVLPKRASVKYFGPYSTGARDLLDSIYELFSLVQKESCLRSKKACLFYQIKRCLAPCEGKISQEEYQKILNKAIACIENPKKILALLEQKMTKLATQLRFEEATILRDRQEKIKRIALQCGVDFAKKEDLDVFALYQVQKQAVLVKFFMRNGKIISNAHQSIKSEYGFDEAVVYEQALINYYQHDLPIKPNQILIPFDLKEKKPELENFLFQRFQKKIPIHYPKNGDKKRLCELALHNAQEILRLEQSKDQSILLAIKELFCLQCAPYRIEIFDTSHHRGAQCVGAMVVYEEEWQRDSYRHYLLEGRDEYSQMHEMLSRRIERFKEVSPPDLWLLDGGKGQINLAKSLLESVGVSIDVLGIAKQKVDFKAYRAKGRAKDIMRDASGKEYELSSSDKRLQFLQKLRDEAHRFAISFHQKQKQKSIRHSELLAIDGVGMATQKKLLAYFGDFERIEKASKEELQKLLGHAMGAKLAHALETKRQRVD